MFKLGDFLDPAPVPIQVSRTVVLSEAEVLYPAPFAAHVASGILGYEVAVIHTLDAREVLVIPVEPLRRYHAYPVVTHGYHL